MFSHWLFCVVVGFFLGIASVGSPAEARSFDWKHEWFLLERAGFEASRYMFNRDPYVPEMDPKDWFGRVAFDIDVRLTPFLRWNNTTHTSGDTSAVRHVGWEFELVMDAWDKVQPFYYHHSQHVMEYSRPSGSFPLVDRYGIRFNLYSRD